MAICKQVLKSQHSLSYLHIVCLFASQIIYWNTFPLYSSFLFLCSFFKMQKQENQVNQPPPGMYLSPKHTLFPCQKKKKEVRCTKYPAYAEFGRTAFQGVWYRQFTLMQLLMIVFTIRTNDSYQSGEFH